MSVTVKVTYAGDGFHPPTASTFVHEGHEYDISLMHIEVDIKGVARSLMYASNANSIRYFEFVRDLSTIEQEEDNVLLIRQRQLARA